ncbi:MAG: DNA mismatch repair endonuclease MutL [Acidobacteria bacterium]|nr:MAG: DNA mismatch repair protein MutL [Acidobacteria bacterium 13_2_20CM_58_27]PYT77539.1 MAG: DNA mismatch repair endonuclease MutL [Acidobacteriota bacterium]PYT88217.1 MAG: DNA mismatch repair endonuclease MutL [Acidobacteriota bacterium]
MSRIRILPESVANKIAAGEVVERPASVVKELLENALDAGGKTVRIEVEQGGKRMIRVTDDGHGMTHDDALLAFERHATSKLKTADDLLSIATLGFRGEALPSIAAVSRLLLETRDESEPEGTRVEFAGGKLLGVKPAGLPAGTTVSVADIFYCVPARRKFLKSDTTELGHIASLVTHYALANPSRQFILSTPTQEVINCAPAEKLADRVYQLFGRQGLDELVEIPLVSAPFRAAVTEAQLDPEEERASLTVAGFTSRPEVQRLNRNGIYIFVNRRLVRDRLILHAIHEAYRNILPPTVFPATLLFLEMPYEEVDVNVHPAKIEVRFRRSQFVHDFTRDTIRQSLMSARPIASFATAATTVAAPPSAGFGNGEYSSGSISAPGGSSVPRGTIPPMEQIGLGSGVASDGGFDLTGAPIEPVEQRIPFSPGSAFGAAVARAQVPAASNWAANLASPSPDAPATLPRPEQIADLKPLGQVNSSFIVAVNGEGLWIVDQHVAHERVLFEQHLEARRAGKIEAQRMLMPLVIELSPRQIVTFERIAEELGANGFEVELMGPKSVAIQAVPAGVAAPDAEKLLREILDGIERENAAISIETLQAKIAASTACHAAIKVNMPLEPSKMEWLLDALARTDCPMSCPHGRPVVLRYSVREIEKAFHRI